MHKLQLEKKDFVSVSQEKIILYKSINIYMAFLLSECQTKTFWNIGPKA